MNDRAALNWIERNVFECAWVSGTRVCRVRSDLAPLVGDSWLDAVYAAAASAPKKPLDTPPE